MKWEKLGRIFDPRDNQRWWCHEFAQGPATLILPDRLRVYFSSRSPRDANGQYVSYTGYADFDRNDPRVLLDVSADPIMPLGDLGCFDEHGVYLVSIVEDEWHTLRCYYAGWSRKQSVRFDTAIGVAFSRNGGASFERAGNGPILAPSMHEPFVLSGPKVRKFGGRWMMFYIAGTEWKIIDGRTEPIYKIKMAHSMNGYEWFKDYRHIISSVLGDDEAQSGPDVHLGADGIYHMYFCYRAAGHHPGREGGLRIGYAWSGDMLTWERDDRQAGIDRSDDPDAWDYAHARYPHVFDLDGQQYMLYNGNEFGRYGFGLARRIK